MNNTTNENTPNNPVPDPRLGGTITKDLTPTRKLETLIQKAIDGEWDAFGTESQQIDVEVVELVNGELQPSIDVDKPGIYICVHRHHGTYSVPELLFNHDFSKALWGTGFHLTNSEYGEGLDEYEHQLQQMVIAEDPIDYAYEAVFGKP